MKTKLLLLLTAVLISSCSIFRKSEKHKLNIKSSVEVEQVITANEQKKEVENSERKSSKVENSESNTSTTIEADEITIHSDGSISAKGNAKANQNRNDKNNSASQEKEVKSKATDTNRQTDSNLTIREDLKVESTDKIPEEPKNPIWNWIGAGLFVVIILIVWRKFR